MKAFPPEAPRGKATGSECQGPRDSPQETQAPFPRGPGVRTRTRSVAVGRDQRGRHCLGFPCPPPLLGRSDVPSACAGGGARWSLKRPCDARRQQLKRALSFSLCPHFAVEKHFPSEASEKVWLKGPEGLVCKEGFRAYLRSSYSPRSVSGLSSCCLHVQDLDRRDC